jgi:hypothetical protein
MSKSVSHNTITTQASHQVFDAFPSLYGDFESSWTDAVDYEDGFDGRSARKAAKEFRQHRRAVRDARVYS